MRRNGGVDWNDTPVPDGQITIFSLVVQENGAYKVYANGTEIMANTKENKMKALVPGVAGPFGRQITIGRNAPDGWTTVNGHIGDVFIYNVALSDADRKELETLIEGDLIQGKK